MMHETHTMASQRVTGFTLVESVLALSLFAFIGTAILGATLYGEESIALTGKRLRAIAVADEGFEAVRNMRDANWALLTTGLHGLATSGSVWSFSGVSDLVDIFTRSVQVTDIDASRKTIVSNVAWQQSPTRGGNLSFTSRLTNWRAPRIGNWAIPTRAAGLDISGNSNGNKIVVSGNYAYFVRDAGNPNLFTVDVTNPSAPVVVSTVTVVGAPTNVAAAGGLLFVTSTDNASELQIFDLSNPASPAPSGFYNAPGTADALGVAAAAGKAYVVRASSASNEFVVIDVTNPAIPTALGSLDLAGAGFEVAHSGNYVFVASGNDSSELAVIDASTPSTPFLASSLDLSGATDAFSVASFEGGVLLGRGSSLYVVDTSVPIVPTLTATFSAGGTVNDVAVGNFDSYAFLATSATVELSIVDFFSLTAPALVGQYNVSGGNPLNGVVYDEARDKAYAVGSLNGEEFTVVAPTPF